RGSGELLKRNSEYPITVKRMVFQRIRGEMRFSKIVWGKTVVIYDQDTILPEVANIHLQRRGIHRDQHVDRIARRVHISGRELNLEPADAGKGARRSADFGRIVGERCQIVAKKRC